MALLGFRGVGWQRMPGAPTACVVGVQGFGGLGFRKFRMYRLKGLGF